MQNDIILIVLSLQSQSTEVLFATGNSPRPQSSSVQINADSPSRQSPCHPRMNASSSIMRVLNWSNLSCKIRIDRAG